MITYRIATESPDYPADDTSGTGARLSGGRWNSKGNAVIYTSSSRALAAMEVLVHLATPGLPLNRYLVEFQIPDALWKKREVASVRQLVGWDAQPHGITSVTCGDEWLTQGRTLILEVPSVIVPEEANILINPGHHDMKKVIATKDRKWTFDPRLGNVGGA